MHANDIPVELLELERWAACRNGCRAITKGQRPAYVCEPRTWLSHEQAVSVADKYGLDSVALAVTEDCGLAVVTVHEAFEPDGTLTTEAQDIVSRLNSFVMVSYDATGVHVVVRADLRVGTSGLRRGSVEVCDRFVFLNFGGQRLSGDEVGVEERQDELDRIWGDRFAGLPEVAPDEGLGDRELIQLALRANANFRRTVPG